MNIPESKRTKKEFIDDIANHVAGNYHLDTEDEKMWRCNECNTVVLSVTCYVSIHCVVRNNCSGWGEVKPIEIPYCPKCEGEPKKDEHGGYRACWHE